MVKTTSQMLNKVLTAVLDFIWGKLYNGLVSLLKKYQIEKEVSDEEKEIRQIRKEIKEHYLKTGDTKIPPELEQRMRDAVSRRNDRLPNNL